MRRAQLLLGVVVVLVLSLAAERGAADDSDYIVRVGYDGPVTLYEVEVLLFDTDRACDTLTQDPEDPPSTDVAWTSVVIRPEADGSIPERGLNVPREVEFHYAVARGEPANGASGGRDYFVTFGCNDQIPTPNPGTATVIDIDMQNLWPELAGSYATEAEGITLRPVPQAFRPARNAIDEFLYDPGLGLLRLMAVSRSGDRYWQSPPWAELFRCRGALHEPYSEYCRKVAPSSLGKLAGRIIEAHVDENLVAVSGDPGATIRGALAMGEEIVALADSFGLGGDLVLEEPDSDGHLGDANSLTLKRVTWQWGSEARTMELGEERFVRGEGIEASVRFHPHPGSSEECSLAMDPLIVLGLSYPKMLFWVLEGVVLPELLGGETDSFAALATRLMDCPLLARRLRCEGPWGSDPDCDPDLGFAVAGIAEGCAILQGGEPDPIPPLVSSLLAGKDSWVLIHTPPHNPCRMSLAPGAFKVQTLGGDPVDFCEWEGEVIVSPDEVAELVNWTWEGESLE